MVKAMTIKNKIRLSNILMVIIPIITILIAVLVARYGSVGSYWHSIETMYQDENGIQSAQSLIYTYQEELWENNWGNNIQNENDKIKKNETMYHLEKKLTKMGYHFLVKREGTVLYSNISDKDMETALKTAGDALHTAKMLTASLDNVSVIKNTFAHGGEEFSIIAVNGGDEECQVESYFRMYIMKYVLLLLVLFFAVTLIVNWILSWWVSESVLVPLEKLRKGTRDIRDGNLDTEIDYHRRDEFGQVCQDFEQMRAYLKESVEQRLENENQRREMINGVSHDLRTPLTSIGGYLDGLIEGIANTPEKQQRYLKAIKIRTKDLERLVDSLSDYNRLESGRVTYHMERGDLKVFFEQYLSTYVEEARQNHVNIRLEAPEKKYPLNFDGNEMKRVFDNLFSNTIRYRENEDSHVLIRITRHMKKARIQVEYQDDGPGVPEESLGRIFDTFYRTDDARSHSGKGSGIGLAVVRKIIRAHGGTVWAENRNGLAVIMEIPGISTIEENKTERGESFAENTDCGG